MYDKLERTTNKKLSALQESLTVTAGNLLRDVLRLRQAELTTKRHRPFFRRGQSCSSLSGASTKLTLVVLINASAPSARVGATS